MRWVPFMSTRWCSTCPAPGPTAARPSWRHCEHAWRLGIRQRNGGQIRRGRSAAAGPFALVKAVVVGWCFLFLFFLADRASSGLAGSLGWAVVALSCRVALSGLLQRLTREPKVPVDYTIRKHGILSPLVGMSYYY
jgi:hypothetical protein